MRANESKIPNGMQHATLFCVFESVNCHKRGEALERNVLGKTEIRSTAIGSNLSTVPPITMSASASATPADIVQHEHDEKNKNPRGIPKALFIVRPLTLRRGFHPQTKPPPFSPLADPSITCPSPERRGGVSRRPRRGHRRGSQCVSGCPSVRVFKRKSCLLFCL